MEAMQADHGLHVEAVREAAARIAPHVVRTPLLRHRLGPDCELLLKPESLQPTGAFKLRGAFNLMLQLPENCPGVVAHSSGNHAQAVARAAAVLGIPAVIVMPSDAPTRKRERTEADGAEVVIVEGLDLTRAEPGVYELICLPILLAGAEGAPARAVLRRLARDR